ncbi:CbtB domain-containing protein [Streptomyces sp. TS71-3]|uniref:CbtB domain-containing protein n=1 Tax=Streptomyces sp. TS71-3 TaxID=2733862 RepID=UPI001B2542FD|nr:CbtB domain-containing protein [Streptomyces sp. TS71-3]GHJ40117.1 cobalt transporter [Streptomyces sp. TS71-3]
MAQSIASPATESATTQPLPVPKLSVRAVLPWAVFFGVLMLVLLYFVGAEQGATSVFSGTDVHEWVHDGRHLLGFPCH